MGKSDRAKSATALTKDAKAMLQLCFEDLGGLPRLVEWANHPANIGTFYTQLWAKIIPKETKNEHTGKDGAPIQIAEMTTERLRNLGSEEILQLENLLTKMDDNPEEGEVVEVASSTGSTNFYDEPDK